MALSFVQYPGDGAKRDFQLTFGYLAKAHVSVSVNGNPYPDFTFTSGFMVQLATAPGKDAIVEVRRTTPRNAPLVDFVDGSTLTETDLDTATLQVFYLAQEAYDMAGGTLAITSDGSYSANTRRIANVGNPVNPQDVVTKLWAETALSSQLAVAIQKASEAAGYATASRGSSETSASYATAASGSAITANSHRAAAASSAQASATSETNALAYRNASAGSSDSAAISAADARDSKVSAAASAAAAAKSAQDAALFDPSSYYTKTQTDAKYLTSASAQNDFYTKTNIDTKFTSYYTKSQIDGNSAATNTAISGKVSKSGDVMSGPLSVVSTLTLKDTTNGNMHVWFRRANDTEAALIYAGQDGVLNFRMNGGTSMFFNTDGNIWSPRFAEWGSSWVFDAIRDRIESRIIGKIAEQGHDSVGTWSAFNQAYAQGTQVAGGSLSYVSNGARPPGSWRSFGAMPGGGALYMRYA